MRLRGGDWNYCGHKSTPVELGIIGNTGFTSLSVHELVQAEDGSGVALPGERAVLVGGDVGVGEVVFGLVEMVFGGCSFGGGDGAAEGQLVGEVEAV